MSIGKPIVIEIAPRTWAVNEFGLSAMFVLEGDTSALVIDTGRGLIDFRTVVEELTHLPYEVVLTHGHGDHCGSMDQFEQVWLHCADHAAALAVTRDSRVAAAARMLSLPEMAQTWDVDAADCREWASTPKLLPLINGQLFHLGGRNVEVLHTPGHSPGEVVLIDHKERILFSGDACNVGLRLVDCPLETGYQSLLYLKAREADFDRNFNGHLGYAASLDHRSMPASTLEDAIAAVDAVLAGGQFEAGPVSPFTGRQTAHVRRGVVEVTFDPSHLREA